MAHEGCHQVIGHLSHPAAVPEVVLFHEMTYQQRYVLTPLSQGRELEGDDGQAVVEVLAQASLSHGLLRVPVRGGYDPHVHPYRHPSSHPVNLPFLKGPQELCLKAGVHLRHLIEKERAPVGQLELAEPPGERPGEGTFLVAEELALQQALRKRGAVHRHEGPLGAGALAMDEPGQKLLSGPALPLDEDGGPPPGRGAGKGEYLEHLRVLRDHLPRGGFFPTG